MMENEERRKWSSPVHRWIAYLILQYELITCTCMFEPWEKVFINSLILGFFGLICYSSFVYLPEYLTSLYAYLNSWSATARRFTFDAAGRDL